jgi:hypothetical protein
LRRPVATASLVESFRECRFRRQGVRLPVSLRALCASVFYRFMKH